MNKIRKTMFYSIIFKHLLLMNDTVTLSSIIVITRQSFIQSSNAIASIFFSSHAELLSSIPIHSLRSQNITSRNLLGGSIAWIEEISRYIFTWMMFMGIAIGVHYKKHLGVEFVVGLYPAKVKKAAYFISDVLTLVLFIILAIYGFRYAGKSMKMFSPIMGIPYGIVYLCVPIGAIFSTFYCFARIIEDYFVKPEDKEDSAK